MSIADLKFTPGHYLAYVISEKSRVQLLRMFPPSFSRVICHHVTVEFNLTEERLNFFKEKFSKPTRGGFPPVLAIGEATGDGIECIAISIHGETTRRDGSFYHATLSLDPPHKPVESNELKDKIELIRGIVPIDGEFVLVKK